jgi:hypothetical protein
LLLICAGASKQKAAQRGLRQSGCLLPSTQLN